MSAIMRLSARLVNHSYNSAQNNVKILLFVLTMTFFFFGWRNILGLNYTGWDSHDLGFISFLYFNDSLQSGTIPLWNPFIQAGSFNVTIFNAGNYSPFQWIFFFLSRFISPIYAYELMLQSVMFIGVLGFYLWLGSRRISKSTSLFGAQTFFLSVLMPLIGQSIFIFSLSALPWLLLVCQKIVNENDKAEWVKYLLYGSIISSFMASGYPWMNIINFTLAFLYASNLIILNLKFNNVSLTMIVRSPAFQNLGYFFCGAIVVIFCYYAPGYFSLKYYYHLFYGDYVSPEPRLRGLVPEVYHSFRGLKEAFFTSVDPRIFLNTPESLKNLPMWTWGVGWVSYLIFFYKIPNQRFFIKNWLWFAIFTTGLFYSAGLLERVLAYLPLFNANRWWFIGLLYVYVSVIILSIDRLKRNTEAFNIKFDGLFLMFGFGCSLMVLILFQASIFEYALIVFIIATIYYLRISDTQSQWILGLALLMSLNLISFASMQHLMPGADRFQKKQDLDYYDKIIHRKISTEVHTDHRQLGRAQEYIFNNEDWIIKKIPFSHGYNPLGNPLYWYLKDMDFLKKFVDMKQSVREENELTRKQFDSDNIFAKSLINDILLNIQTPTVNMDLVKTPPPNKLQFKWILNKFTLEPNRAVLNITTSNAAYLVFYNTYFPGWEVFLNGKKRQLLLIDRIFQGIQIPSPGTYDVTFKFQPPLLLGILLFPLLFMIFLMFVHRLKVRCK